MSQSHQTNPTDGFDAGLLGEFEVNRETFRKVIYSRLGRENAHAVDDILQEMAVAASTAKQGSIANPGSWLRQVLNHKVADFWRRKSRLDQLQDAAEPNTQMSLSPFEWVLHFESRDQIRNAMKCLSVEDRDLLQRKYIATETCDQMAAALGLSLKAVEYRLDRARKNLRKKLTDWKNE